MENSARIWFFSILSHFGAEIFDILTLRPASPADVLRRRPQRTRGELFVLSAVYGEFFSVVGHD